MHEKLSEQNYAIVVQERIMSEKRKEMVEFIRAANHPQYLEAAYLRHVNGSVPPMDPSIAENSVP
jgi:hypothetical protein